MNRSTVLSRIAAAVASVLVALTVVAPASAAGLGGNDGYLGRVVYPTDGFPFFEPSSNWTDATFDPEPGGK